MKKTTKKKTAKRSRRTVNTPVLTGADIEAAAAGMRTDERDTSGRKRFRMLRILHQTALRNRTKDYIAEKVGMTVPELEAMLRADPAAAEAVRSGRLAAEEKLMRIMWDHAEKGNHTITKQLVGMYDAAQEKRGMDVKHVPVKLLARLCGRTVDQMEYLYRTYQLPKNPDGTVDLGQFMPWFERHIARTHTFDPGRVKQIELEPFLGVTRQTVAAWTKSGMPKNADGTYSLAEVFAWRIEQVGGQPGKFTEAVNPLTQIKAEKLQIEVDAARGRLIDRAQVITGLIARAQSLAAFMDRKADELPALLANLTADRIKGELDKFFADLRSAAAQVPEDIASLLPDGRREGLKTVLDELLREDDDGD